MFNGASAQTISLGLADGRHYFSRIELDNATGLTFNTVGWLTDGVTITNGNVDGVDLVHVANYIVDGVGDRWRVPYTRFTGTSVTTPASMKTLLYSTSANNLVTDVAVDSVRIDNGSFFDANGHTVRSRGQFHVVGTGVLNMDASADVIDVGGDLYMNRTDGFTPTFNAGLIKVQGNFTTGVNSSETFRGSGSHKVLFNGSGTQTITLGLADGRHYFANIDVAAGSTASLASTLQANNDMHLYGTLTAAVARTFNIGGTLFKHAGSTLSGNITVNGTQTNVP